MKTIRIITKLQLSLLILFSLTSSHAADEFSYQDYPLQQYYYAINSSSFGRASFYVASGLGDFVETGNNGSQNSVTAQVTLSRGVFFDSQLFSSYISGNSVTPEKLTIQLMDSSGNISATWELSKAYMVSYDISAEMQNGGIPVNSVTLAYGWMQRIQ